MPRTPITRADMRTRAPRRSISARTVRACRLGSLLSTRKGRADLLSAAAREAPVARYDAQEGDFKRRSLGMPSDAIKAMFSIAINSD